MERGCWAALLQELSQVQRQEGLQRGQAEGTDHGDPGRAEARPRPCPAAALRTSCRPSVHLLLCLAGSPCRRYRCLPPPQILLHLACPAVRGALARPFPTIRDPGPAPRGGSRLKWGRWRNFHLRVLEKARSGKR